MRRRTEAAAMVLAAALLLSGCSAQPTAKGLAGPTAKGLTGQVTKADGSPASSLPVLITGPKGFVGPTDHGYIALSTDSEGRFASPSDYTLPDGTYTIHAGRNEPWTEDIASQVTVTPDDVVETTRRVPVLGDHATVSDLTLESAGSIVLSSADATQVLVEDADGRVVRNAKAESKGFFRAGGLRAGTYTVVASRAAWAKRSGWGVASVTVRAGQESTSPPVPLMHALLSAHGHVIGAPATVRRPFTLDGGLVGSDFGYDIGAQGSAILGNGIQADSDREDAWSMASTLIPGLYYLGLTGGGPYSMFRLTTASSATSHDVRYKP